MAGKHRATVGRPSFSSDSQLYVYAHTDQAKQDARATDAWLRDLLRRIKAVQK